MPRSLHAERAAESPSEAVAHLPDALVTLDREWRYTFVNEAAAAMIGRSEDELLGLTIWESFPDTVETSLGGELRRAMEERSPVRFETSAIGGVWKEVRAAPTESGIAVLFDDISARKDAEREALRLFGTTSLLLDAARALTSDTGLGAVLPAFADALLQAVPHKRIAVASYDEQRREIRILYSKGEGAFPEGVYSSDTISRPAHEAIDEQRPVVIDYDRLPDEEAGGARRNRARLSLVVPLVLAGRPIGIVFMDSPGERISVEPRDLQIVQGIASEAAAVIENARLLRAESEARAQAGRELEKTGALLRASRALAEPVGLDRVLASLAEVLLSATAHTRSYVFLWDARARRVTQVASVGVQALPPVPVFEFEELSAPTKRVIETRVTEVVDFDALPPAERGHGLVTVGSHVVVVVPIVWRGELVGVLGVDDPGERRPFTQPEIELCEAIAAQAAVAISNARLHDLERESGRLTEALNAIDHSIHSTLSVGEILHRVVPEATDALGCESAAMGFREDDGWVVRIEYRLREGLAGRRFTDEELPIACLAAERQDVQVVDDALAHPLVNAETRLAFDAVSFMTVPLIAREEVVGAIYFIYHTKLHHFSEAEVDFARRLSASLGLAVANARIYESQRTIAETLQTALLALPQRIPGVEFAHAYHSATEEARVGGDFYDLFDLEHERLGVTVGDISGHGIDAAVLTSLVKNTIRVQATEEAKTPAQAMTAAHNLLFRSSPPEMFATVFFGVLDCPTGRLVYCNAGHTTGALVSADGGVTKLDANSPLVGAFPDASFVDSDSSLGKGDVLFLYTDGLTEAHGEQGLYGEERLFELLAQVATRPAEDIVQAVLDDVLSFARGHLSDDLAIIAVRRLGPSG